MLFKKFIATGALGQPNNSNRGLPTVIETLKGKGPFKQVTAGYQFAFALTGKKLELLLQYE